MAKLARTITGAQAQRLAWDLLHGDQHLGTIGCVLTKGTEPRDLRWEQWMSEHLRMWVIEEGQAENLLSRGFVEFKQPHAHKVGDTLLQVSPGDWYAERMRISVEDWDDEH